MQTAMVPIKPIVRVDPRSKFLLLFVVGSVIFTHFSKLMEIIIFASLSLLLVFGRQYRTVFRFGAVFTLMMLLDTFAAGYLSGAFGAAFLTLVRLPRLVLPVCLSGMLLMRTTTVSEFIAAFRKMHITEKVIIPFSVMFRFIPTVREEWTSIRNAMRFRGIGVSVKNVLMRPMITLEYVMIPLLMSTATISSELAAASLSRGLDSEAKRSCITQVRLGAADYIIIMGCIGLIVYVTMAG